MMGFFGIGMLMMAAFWVLLIGGAVWLVVTLVRGSQSNAAPNSPHALMLPASGQTPLDILKTRYAKGEITKEQFEQMKTDLG